MIELIMGESHNFVSHFEKNLKSTALSVQVSSTKAKIKLREAKNFHSQFCLHTENRGVELQQFSNTTCKSINEWECHGNYVAKGTARIFLFPRVSLFPPRAMNIS
jgi:hypothetical protein